MQAQRQREDNKGTHKTIKECIKPGNIIDDDISEYMERLREGAAELVG